MNWFKSFWEALNTPLVNEGGEFAESMTNFTPRAQQVLALARKEAARFNHNFVGTEHLLLGLIRLGQGTAVNVMGKMGLELKSVQHEVERQIGTGPDQKVSDLIPYTPRVKKVLALAAKEAKALKHTYIGTEHILLGLLREGDGVAARVLANLGVNTDVTRQHVLREIDPSALAPNSGALPVKPESQELQRDAIDIGKRYDVYCREGEQEVVYRNARFKNIKTLFKKGKTYDFIAEFIELEQSDGGTIFIARPSVIKFCEHGTTPGSEIVSGA